MGIGNQRSENHQTREELHVNAYTARCRNLNTVTTFFHKANISVCKNFKYSRWLHFEFPSNKGQLHNYGLTICTSLLHRALLIMHKQ
jgi:hypothetical protein